MQPKESKSNWHFTISLIKSFMRMGAGTALLMGYVFQAGGLLILAEILGIMEEF